MQVSDRLTELVASEEGVVTRAYRDVVGILTIGVGHTSAAGGLQVKPGMEITRAQALELLRADLQMFWGRVQAKMGPNALSHELEGATSFDFNTGAIKHASWVDSWTVTYPPHNEAERRFKLWHKAGGKRVEGLVKRRAREADIIFRDIWPSHITTDASAWRNDRAMLEKLGYASSSQPEGSALYHNVREFQADNGLVVDGIIGPATRATLRRAVAAQTSTRVAAGSGAAGTGGSLAAGIGANTGDLLTELLPLAIGLGVVVGVLAGSWIWRNRGRLGLVGARKPKVEMADV
ncbi:MAG: peptidoglycan-binding protein [Paracoccaceae bacterium]